MGMPGLRMGSPDAMGMMKNLENRKAEAYKQIDQQESGLTKSVESVSKRFEEYKNQRNDILVGIASYRKRLADLDNAPPGNPQVESAKNQIKMQMAKMRAALRQIDMALKQLSLAKEQQRGQLKVVKGQKSVVGKQIDQQKENIKQQIEARNRQMAAMINSRNKEASGNKA